MEHCEVVALVGDLWFAARVESLVAQGGRRGRVTTRPEEFVRWIRDEAPERALVDITLLDGPGPVTEALSGVKQVAGFGPHVDGTRFQEARSWGIRTLWANSALGERLPAWLRET